ncbi:MAG: HlyD family efflux transporter periplasmic adaptor subunit [Hyphomicrobiales bacterium]|nr:HlyD family efflux transporter periplasmic adaptor subunit [Hyphomicrobiales bacterium]
MESARANLANVQAGVRQEERDTAAQNVAIAASNVTLAKEQFAPVSVLAAKNYASKQQFDEDAAALSEAQASLVLAQAALAQSKVGPTKEELGIAQSQVALALATVADLEAQLAKTTLTSPVDGVARLLVAEPGEAISPGQPVLTFGVAGERWFTFTIREDRLSGLAMGSKIALRTAAGDRFEAKVTELRPLGEFAVWRAARAVGDHDINSFLLRADPIRPTPNLEPGMTVWIDEGQAG